MAKKFVFHGVETSVYCWPLAQQLLLGSLSHPFSPLLIFPPGPQERAFLEFWRKIHLTSIIFLHSHGLSFKSPEQGTHSIGVSWDSIIAIHVHHVLLLKQEFTPWRTTKLLHCPHASKERARGHGSLLILRLGEWQTQTPVLRDVSLTFRVTCWRGK